MSALSDAELLGRCTTRPSEPRSSAVAWDGKAAPVPPARRSRSPPASDAARCMTRRCSSRTRSAARSVPVRSASADMMTASRGSAAVLASPEGEIAMEAASSGSCEVRPSRASHARASHPRPLPPAPRRGSDPWPEEPNEPPEPENEDALTRTAGPTRPSAPTRSSDTKSPPGPRRTSAEECPLKAESITDMGDSWWRRPAIRFGPVARGSPERIDPE